VHSILKLVFNNIKGVGMKKIMLIAISFIFVLGAQLLLANKSEAGYNDPWYACYVVSGRELQTCKGPFDNKFSCGAERYNIPIGAKWLGCKQ